MLRNRFFTKKFMTRKFKSRLTQRAYAKINVALDIGHKNKESGYHKISTILQQIDLHDTLTIKKISPPGIIIEISKKSHVPKSDLKNFPLGEKNTIYKAIKILCENQPSVPHFQMPSGLHITIEKNIPIAAGLGGGSSDAAATLKALNTLWKLNLSTKKLEKLASKIGMDVPFFIRGGTSYATHYGGKIHDLPPLKNWHALLIDPGERMSTAEAYKKIDSFQNSQDIAKTRKLLRTLKNPDLHPKTRENFAALIHNDFDKIYQKKFQTMRKKLSALGAQKITCTGSGPLHFAVFKNISDLESAFKKLEKSSWKVWKMRAMQSRNKAA